jgi:hypothetical protein
LHDQSTAWNDLVEYTLISNTLFRYGDGLEAQMRSVDAKRERGRLVVSVMAGVGS